MKATIVKYYLYIICKIFLDYSLNINKKNIPVIAQLTQVHRALHVPENTHM